MNNNVKKNRGKIDVFLEILVGIYAHCTHLGFVCSTEHWQSDWRVTDFFADHKIVILWKKIFQNLSSNRWSSASHMHPLGEYLRSNVMTQLRKYSRASLDLFFFWLNNLTWVIPFLRVSIYFVILQSRQLYSSNAPASVHPSLLNALRYCEIPL